MSADVNPLVIDGAEDDQSLKKRYFTPDEPPNQVQEERKVLGVKWSTIKSFTETSVVLVTLVLLVFFAFCTLSIIGIFICDPPLLPIVVAMVALSYNILKKC